MILFILRIFREIYLRKFQASTKVFSEQVNNEASHPGKLMRMFQVGGLLKSIVSRIIRLNSYTRLKSEFTTLALVERKPKVIKNFNFTI